jgi:hypothetical protein
VPLECFADEPAVDPAVLGAEAADTDPHPGGAHHVREDREGAYVGVGSVCKRDARPASILAVLHAILSVRPDLRLHGFGLKTTALTCAPIADLLYSADSMAWSFAARWEGRNANDWREAETFRQRIADRRGFFLEVQGELSL